MQFREIVRENASKAEVTEFGDARSLLINDVLRLKIAMDEVAFVHICHGVADLHRNRNLLSDRDRLVVFMKIIEEVRASNVLTDKCVLILSSHHA